MKKSLLLVLSLTLSILGAFAQQKMKDGTVAQNNLPNKDAILELESTNKGLLFSRISLKSSKDPSPLAAHTAGMMVYNTQSISDVVPGIYYNDGTKWILARQGQASNISYNPTTYTITFTDPSTNLPVVVDLKDVVKKNETLTFLVKQENGTYLYTSENGNKTIINVPADVINNFQAIANDNSVRTILESIFKSTGGNVSYDGTNFTYIDNAGVKQTINISQLVKANETVTTLIDNKNGTYTYTAEDGKQTIINVPANVISNFQSIANDNSVRTIIENIVRNTGGNVFYDGANFTYVDNNGVKQVINISQLVKANETVTTLIDNKNGTYTYTAEDGKQTIINVPANVISNFQSIANDNSVRTIIENIVRNTGGNVFYDGANFTYVDNNGVKQVINISQLVKANETVTTLIDNKNGTYTYTAEDGKQTIINVPADVISNFQNIANDNSVRTIIENIVKNTGGNVFYDGANFTYVDNSGVKQTINISQIVKANETKTTLTYDNTKNELTYTGEDGVAKVIDLNDGALAYDKTTNTLNYTDGKGVVTALPLNTTALVYDKASNALTYTDSKGAQTTIAIKDLVAANETKTTLTYDNTKNELTYTGEDGVSKLIDLNDGALAYDKTTNTLNYTDGKGVVTALPLNTTALVYDKASNALTYTDSKGAQTTIAIKDLVAANETKTTLTYDNTKNELTYTGEDGVAKLIDLNDGALAYDKTTNTLNYTDGKGVVTALPLNTTALVYDKANNALTYTDSKGVSTTIAIKDLVEANQLTSSVVESVTTNVTSAASAANAKNTEYKVEVKDLAITTAKLANNAVTTDKVAEKAITSTKLDAGAGSVGRVGVADANGVVTYQNLSPATLTGKKDITTDGIISVNNANLLTGAVLETTDLKINDNSITTKKINAPAGTNKLVLGYDGAGNVIWSTVDGIAGSTTVSNNITGTALTTTVNGTTGAAVDLKDAIQLGQKTSVVAAGTGTIVTPSTTGNVTTYTVAADLANITLAGDVTGAANATKVEKLQGTPVNATAPAVNQVLTFENGAWVGKKPTVGAADVLNAGNLTSDQITFADGNGATLKNVVATVKTKSITAAMLNSDGATAGQLATADGTGGVTYKTFDATALANKKAITGDGITVNSPAGDGTDAVLKDVKLGIADNAITTAKIANDAVETSDIKDKNVTAAKLTAGTSTVVNRVATADAAGNVTYTDLTTLVTGAETKLVNGTNTTVTGSGTTADQYKVNVATANGTALGVVKQGNGSVVVAADGGLSVDAAAITTGKALSSTDLSLSANAGTSLLKDVTINIKDKAVTATKLGAATDGTDANKVATADAAGNVTYKAITDASIVSAKKITGSDINVLGGDGATLKDVSLSIKQGTAGQILTTNAAGTATEWVNKADATSVSNTSSGNSLTTTVNGKTGTAVNIINTNALSLDADKKLVSTVNGIATTPALDLTPAITAAQKTASVKNASDKVSVVTTGTGTAGNNTEYSVDVVESKLTLSNLGGKVTNSQITTGTANQVLITKADGTTTQWVDQSTLVPTTTNILSSSANTLTSDVNGVSRTAPIINTNTLTLDGSNKLVSTVNSVATTPALDLTPAIAAAQKTSSVVNGTTTTVTSTIAGNNTAYKVEVTDAAIQAGQNTTSLSNGSNTTVTSTTSGKNTNYIVNTNVASTSVTGAVKPGAGLAIDGTGTLTVNASTITTGQDVTTGSDKIKLGGTPVGAALKAFSVDVDETKLNLNANQIKGGTAGQVMVVGAGNVGSWVDKSTLVPATVVSNTSAGNSLSTTVNGVTGTGVNIINSNALALDGTNKLVGTVNGQATTALDLTPAIQAAQKTTTVVAGTNVTVSPATPAATGNTAYTVNVATANGTAPGVVKQGNGSVVVATDGALSVDAAAITTGQNVTSTNKIILTGTPTGAALKPFNIDVDETKLNLQNMAGKVTNNQIATGTTGQVLITNAAGTTQWVDQSTLGDNTTASNGLTKTANNIQLGGALTAPTAIATTGTNTLAISGLPITGTTADKIVVADPTSGVLKLANAAMPKWFYMPSIVLDVATIGTGKTVNLYNLYKSQFESVPGTMNSTGVQKSIPFLLNPADLEYYVTYVDATVITVTSVNANGVMTYNVTGKAKTTSFANIVFVVK